MPRDTPASADGEDMASLVSTDMTAQEPHRPASPGWRELNIGGGEPIDDSKRLDLRDLGFVYRVSDEARAEIRANERRAARVLTTAHLYWFGGSRG